MEFKDVQGLIEQQAILIRDQQVMRRYASGKREPSHIQPATSKVEIIGFQANSHTMVNVKDLERGTSWNEQSHSYDGKWICSNGTCRKDTSRNKGYGEEFTVHRKHLFISNETD